MHAHSHSPYYLQDLHVFYKDPHSLTLIFTFYTRIDIYFLQDSTSHYHLLCGDSKIFKNESPGFA